MYFATRSKANALNARYALVPRLHKGPQRLCRCAKWQMHRGPEHAAKGMAFIRETSTDHPTDHGSLRPEYRRTTHLARNLCVKIEAWSRRRTVSLKVVLWECLHH